MESSVVWADPRLEWDSWSAYLREALEANTLKCCQNNEKRQKWEKMVKIEYPKSFQTRWLSSSFVDLVSVFVNADQDALQRFVTTIRAKLFAHVCSYSFF
jgi:hypothetical protein